jgi:hypothetical protein
MTNFVTINGHTYSDSTNDGGVGNRYLANGGHRANFLPLVTDIVITADALVVTAADATAAIEAVAATATVAIEATAAASDDGIAASAAAAQTSATAALAAQLLAQQAQAGAIAVSLNVPTGLPSVRPALNLDFSNSQSVDARISCARASTATRVNAKGLIESVAANVPRLDFDPMTLACKGLLIEEQRTNLLLWSEDFSNSAWVKSGATITANAATAPDGAVTADKLVEDSALGNHYATEAFASFVTGTAYTVSVYVKAGERNFFSIQCSAIAATGGIIFNLLTGAAVTAYGGASLGMASVTDAGGGWWRLIITFSSVLTGSSNLYMSVRSTNSTSAYTGDGASGLYLWGVQLVASAGGSSYIPTTSAQATRAADAMLLSSPHFSSWYSPLEGSFVCVGDSSATVAGQYFFCASDNTANNLLAVESYPAIEAIGTVGGVGQWDISSGAYTASSVAKMAIGYKLNDIAVSANGAAVVTDTVAALPTVTQLQLGSSPSGVYLNGHIKQLSYYPKRLANSELQALTS